MDPVSLAIAAGFALFSGIAGYEGSKSRAQKQQNLQSSESAVADYNQKLGKYYQVKDFDSISGIKTSDAGFDDKGKAMISLDDALADVGDDYVTSDRRGFMTLNSTGEVIGRNSINPIDSSALAQQAVLGAVSTGISMYSAVSGFNASRAK